MKLNIGCGNLVSQEKDVINVDIHEYAAWPGLKEQGCQFQLADLNDDWPWKDNSIEMIHAKDIVEHLPDQIHTMMEAYRVLQPGGAMHIWVPTTDSLAAFADPTHKSYWNVNTFYYFTDQKHENWGAPLYSEQIPNRFKLIAVKVFMYRNLPNSRGVYVHLQKPNPADMDDKGDIEEKLDGNEVC